MESLRKIFGKSTTDGDGNYVLPTTSSRPGILTRLAGHPPSGLKACLARCIPGSCLLCGAKCASGVLCAACQADLPPAPAIHCPLCGEATTHGERCGACLREPPHFVAVHAPFRYEFPVDRLIHALKYGHQLPLATWFGEQLAASVAGLRLDTIVPLPLHPQRLRERGFNQSLEIAKALGKCLHLPVDRSSLVRTRETPPQAGLDRKERRRNVRGAFACNATLSERHVLLVDDVLTSGASADECARQLLTAGAASVHVAVIARTLAD